MPYNVAFTALLCKYLPRNVIFSDILVVICYFFTIFAKIIGKVVNRQIVNRFVLTASKYMDLNLVSSPLQVEKFVVSVCFVCCYLANALSISEIMSWGGVDRLVKLSAVI